VHFYGHPTKTFYLQHEPLSQCADNFALQAFKILLTKSIEASSHARSTIGLKCAPRSLYERPSLANRPWDHGTLELMD
jgi:hypothetical protein